MRVLVTGFDPFGGEKINASLEAVRRLPARVGALEIETAALPTSYGRSLRALEAAIARVKPEIVLCVERVAVNVQDARIPDNDGAQPVDAPIVAGGPTAYLATLPVRAAVAALRAEALPAELSMSAGTFVCNHVFYGLMHLAATRRHVFRGGFLHVPCLPQQAAGNAPSMAPERIARGIAVVLEASATETTDA